NHESFSHLIIDDTAGSAERANAVLSIAPAIGQTPETGKVTNLAPAEIDYVTNDVSAVDLKTNRHASSITVTGTPDNNFLQPLTTLTSNGFDTFSVQAPSAQGPLQIVGNTGSFDDVFISSTASPATTAGVLSTIQGNVTLTGPSQETFVTVDDSLDHT